MESRKPSSACNSQQTRPRPRYFLPVDGQVRFKIGSFKAPCCALARNVEVMETNHKTKHGSFSSAAFRCQGQCFSSLKSAQCRPPPSDLTLNSQCHSTVVPKRKRWLQGGGVSGLALPVLGYTVRSSSSLCVLEEWKAVPKIQPVGRPLSQRPYTPYP